MNQKGYQGEHLGGWYEKDGNTYMPDVWDRLIQEYGIRSVVDVGCGSGINTLYFKDKGCRVLGVEGDAAAIAVSKIPADVVGHDYTLGPFAPDGDWDLGWSSEFLEHVDEQYQANYMATFKKCKHLCITHAVPNQPGYHHVNCKDDGYWLARFTEQGFTFDPAMTAWLRSTDVFKAGWGRCTLMMFHR